MIGRGFERNTPKKEIISKLHAVLVDSGFDGRAEMPFTFGPMVSSGVIRFDSMKSKLDFKKWLAEYKDTSCLDGLWLSDNIDKDRRQREVIIGKVAKALHEKGDGKGGGKTGKRKDITIDWRRAVVYSGREEIARVSYEGKLELKADEIIILKDRIMALITEVGIEGVEVELKGSK